MPKNRPVSLTRPTSRRTWKLGAAVVALTLGLVGIQGVTPASAATPAPGAVVNIGGTWLPTWVSVSPDGAYAYVTDWSGVLHKIDTSTDSIVSTLGGFYSPEPVIISTDGKYAYVANRDMHSVKQVDLASFTITKSWDNLGSVCRLAISADGATVYVTNLGSWTDGHPTIDGVLMSIDVATGSVATIATGLAMPDWVSLIPGTSDALVGESLAGSGSVKRINLTTGAQVASLSVPNGVTSVVVNSTGTFAYAGAIGDALPTASQGFSGSVQKIDLATNSVVDTVTGFTNIVDVSITPDGHSVLVGTSGVWGPQNDGAGAGMYQIDTATDQIVQSAVGGKSVRIAAPMPDSKSAYINAGYPGGVIQHVGLVSLPLVVGPQEIVGTGLGVASAVAIAPNGDQWVADYSASTIQVFRGGSVVQTISGPDLVRPHGIVFGRDGTAYVANFGDRIQSTLDGFVSRIAPGSTSAVRWVGGFAGLGGIAIGPDDVLYVGDGDGNRVYSISPTGSVSTFGPSFAGPHGVALSPNGDIAVADIEVTTANSGALKILHQDGSTTTAVSGQFPVGVASDLHNGFFVTSNTGTVHWIHADGRDETIASGLYNVAGVGYSNGYVYITTWDSAKSLIRVAIPSLASPHAVSAPTATFTSSVRDTAKVSWTAATSSDPITGYTVTSLPDALTCATVSTDTDPLSCVISGLLPNKTYRFSVVAKTAGGVSSPSPLSGAIATPIDRDIAGTPGVTFLTSDGEHVWASLASSAAVAEIDPVQGTVIRTIPVGNYAYGISVDAKYVWAVGIQSASVTQIERSTGNVVRTINVGSGPTAVSSDGLHVWVDVTGSQEVYELSAIDGSFIRTIPVGLEPYGVASDGRHVWVTSAHSNIVTEIDASSGAVIQTIPVDSQPERVSVDDHFVWVTNSYSNEVTQLSAVDGSLTRKIPVGGTTNYGPVSISSDGLNVWVTDVGANAVTKIDAGTGQLVGTPLALTPPAGSVASDGKYVFVGNPSSGIVRQFETGLTTNVPALPTGVTASAGVGSATVSWTPVASVGVPVLGYTVTASPGGRTCATHMAVDASPYTCTISGLTAGTAYTFSVKAENIAGFSVASADSSAVTIIGRAPSEPTDVRATVGNSSIDVAWGTPVDPGTSAITSYTATASPGGAACSTNLASDANPLGCTIAGLVNGQAYKVSVRAENLAGLGPKGLTHQEVQVGTWFACGIGADQLVSCWGDSTNGGAQPPIDLGRVRALASAAVSSCAVRIDNTVRCWGSNPHNEISVPALPKPVKSISGYNTNYCVIFSDDTGQCWGYNDVGQANIPNDLGPLAAVAAGRYFGCAVQVGGALRCWGSSAFGGSPPSSISRAQGVSVGEAVACAIDQDRHVQCWTGTGGFQDVVNAPTGLSNVESVSVGWHNACALTFAGDLTCWGSTAPVALTGSGISGVSQMDTGDAGVCALKTDGTSQCFASGGSLEAVPSQIALGLTPLGTPSAPSSVTAVAGNASASVSWAASSNDGGSPVTSYTVSSAPSGASCIVTGLTASCSGLTNGMTYTFSVVATNRVGDSAPSDPSSTVVPAGVPSAPTNVTAVAGNGRATISWAAPTSDGGSPITGYAVSLQPGGATCSTTIGVEANPLTCSITGLVNGRTYSIQASSTNAYSASTSVSSTTVLGITDNGSALGTDSTGGLYVASADGYGRSAMIIYYPWQGSPSKLLVPSSPWWPDQVTVDATSPTDVFYTDQGSNPFICAGVLWHFDGTTSTGIQPAGTCKPSGVVLDDSGHLYFQDVRRDYLVNAGDPVYYKGNASAPYNWVVVTSAEWQAAWDAQHGVSDGVGVGRATAILGSVTFSDVGPQILRTGVLPQGFVTPRAVAPSAPTDVTAVAGNASASVSWTAPADNGGAAITSYAVTSSPAGGSCAVTDVTANCTGLTNGTAYTFTVVATNSAGNSPASAASATVTPATTPDAPTSVTATAGVRSASVSWTAPANNGGASITGYTVTSSPSGASCVVNGTTASCTGLANATSYTFTVVATNRVGNSASSAASAVITTPGLPSAPTGVTATAGDTTVAVSWTAPASDGGSPITAYVVASSPAAGSCVVTGTAAACSGLTNGTAYTFTVKARSAVGDSAASTTSNPVTPQLRPNSPTGLTVTPGNGLLTVKWTAATVRTGVAITGYTATATSGGFTCSTTAPRNGSAPTTCNIVGLVNGTSYVVSLVANSANGASSAVVAAAATPRTVPSAPGGVTGVAGNGQVTVSWLAPASNGGSPITGYTVTSSRTSGTCTTTGALTCVVTGLTNGTSYTFTVKATNAAGTSIATSASAGVVPIGAPTAPRTVTATANTKTHVVTVKWSAPTSTGGASIVVYTATLYNALTGGTVVTTCTTSAVGPTSPATTCVMPAVAAGTYYVDVTATNASGFVSPASSPRTRIVA